MNRKVIFAFLTGLLCIVSISAQTTAVVKTERKNDETELRRQSFEKVWNTINEKHYDPTFGGVDWKKVREIYEPKAMTAKNTDEFHNVLRQMVGELKLSHFGIIPQEAKIETDQIGGGTIGVELKMIDGKAIFNQIEKGSTAEKAGLKKGFLLSKINGKSIAEILAPLEKILEERKEDEKVRLMYREYTLMSQLDGKPETTVKIEILNEKDQKQIFDVARYVSNYEISEAVGNFPGQKVLFESKRLEGNIGYIRFNIWVIPQMMKVRQAMRELADTKGIIFDLRRNPGGISGMAAGIAGLLSKERITLGSMKGRETEQNFIVYPQPNPFPGKIMILSDNGTGSTSEIFAAGLQENGRAKVIGETSAGAILPSVFDTLPTNAIFQYPISDYKSPKNVLIEGRGVKPDVEVKLTVESLRAGRDLQLEEAVKQILN